MTGPQTVRVSFDLALRDAAVIPQQVVGTIHVNTAPPKTESPLIAPCCVLFNLTPAESRALVALLDNEHVNRQAMHVAVSPNGVPVSRLQLVDVFICKLRKKLERHGIEIATLRGVGFRLDKAARQRVRRLLADYDVGLPTADQSESIMK